MNTPITLTTLPERERIQALPKQFPRTYLEFENTVYRFARHLSDDYNGGFWDYYRTSNGAFFMAPVGKFDCENAANYSSATLSGLSFGLTVCLMVCSSMSFEPIDQDALSDNYHALHDTLFDCAQFDEERADIMRLID
jgi:hypothetical protein